MRFQKLATVLVLAGTEINFLVSGTALCFGFGVTITLITLLQF